MIMKWVAIDDEPPALELIKAYAAKIPALKLIRTFDDAIEGATFLRKNSVDLLFLDINMPDITGIELLRSFEKKPITIFTTAYKKFAFEGYELDALDYLLKPIEFDRFCKAVNKAVDYFRYKNGVKNIESEVIYVRSEYQLVKVNLDDIEYIESFEDYIKIYINAAKPVMTLMTLKTIMEKLSSEKFIRIHRSYIVPIAKIKSLVNRKVNLGAIELPVSDTYIDIVRSRLKV